jgi:hypothetical protein
MSRSRTGLLPLSAAVLAVGVSLPVALMTMTTSRSGPSETRGRARRATAETDLPPALARHLERLEALPGFEGPGSAAEAAFWQRAFPEADIPLPRLANARVAMKGHRLKGFPKGRGRPGAWVTIGPSEAVYPFFPLRTSGLYVPNEYVAGGRTTTLALAGDCTPARCRLYAGPVGGGLWRTDNALHGRPHWEYLSSPFEINSAGSIAVDPNDPTGNTLWVGTGEANACSSGCEAGVGLYKSTDGGDTWTGPFGKAVFEARGVGTIAIKPGDPFTIYAASTRAIRGVSPSWRGGGVSIIPGAARWGLYKSTDGGDTWTFIHNGAAATAGCTGDVKEAGNLTPCSPRGVRRVVLDPSDPNTVYAGSYARGVWRSSDAGTTWTQIKTALISTPSETTARPELAVTTLPNGKTRMYVAEGASGSPASRLFRSDDVATGAPAFMTLTSSNPAHPGYGSFDYCSSQCWYDNFVVTPSGHPDVVYLGGSYQYGETGGISNGRAVLLSTDAGVSFTDLTMDATDEVHPNGIHPDQHSLVVHPDDPFQFFEASDGGIIRVSGPFADVSASCNGRGLSPPALGRCQQLLSRVPTRIESLNKGLSTLQFQSLSASPHNPSIVQGGTQDNGTWQSAGNPVRWTATMIGDGGRSGFDVVNPHFRFHTYAGAQMDVNFKDGDTADWNWIGDPLVNGDPAEFQVPIISDPRVSGTMFVGTAHLWRTKTHGLGSMTREELRAHCNEWTGDFTVACGDWEPLGGPGAAARLTCSSAGPATPTCPHGSDRAGGVVAAVARAQGDASTLWAATSTGRVFVSRNADAEPAGAVTFTRIDSLAANAPGRYVSGIALDPARPNHAWISLSGWSAATPATPGHLFEVLYDPTAGTATWTDRSYDFKDIPMNDVVRDESTGDLYAASDFGVFLLPSGSTSWTLAAPGMPNVEVAGLTLAPSARTIYAATRGLGAWSLKLP